MFCIYKTGDYEAIWYSLHGKPLIIILSNLSFSSSTFTWVCANLSGIAVFLSEAGGSCDLPTHDKKDDPVRGAGVEPKWPRLPMG